MSDAPRANDAPIRVLVVDDSAVVRRMVTHALTAAPGVEVAGVAHHGQMALDLVQRLRPDLITMDIEMPVLDGIATVTQLRDRGVRCPIIMFSTLTAHGAAATLDALAAGATDYVTKPSRVADPQQAIDAVAHSLVPKIIALCRRPAPSRPLPLARTAVARTRPVRAVVVGSSTGGPEALSTLLRGIPEPLPVPMLVVQHMPPVFTAHLAARLDRHGPHRVVEASAHQRLEPGTVYIAPGDFHLEVDAPSLGQRLALHRGPQVNYCRPAVDVLFDSAVRAWGGDVVGVVLTGMGHDGRDGAKAIVDAGGTVIAQDRDTSVVWGIPGAVVNAGLAHQVLPIDRVGPAVAAAVSASLRPHRRLP
ncbi:chemotaxis-specific protein-glutamate methyltransferase CheB [Demequina sp.]|uniref:chemotaxis-specific protein-glutamate methyltransferase CheB n=1 Tax=Demequina sp. TaxID=2050685 RepID=UPI003A84AD4B